VQVRWKKITLALHFFFEISAAYVMKAHESPEMLQDSIKPQYPEEKKV